MKRPGTWPGLRKSRGEIPSVDLATVMAVMTAVMDGSVRRNNRSGENDEGNNGKQNIANLHSETPRSDIPGLRVVRLDAAYC
jgi:hypothetical protein